ncbi:MAG TPA: tRNA pseudouridine(55) synthase TruB [Actinomycetota bacterium]|nr:tRNA pseudouridine(55) synthase TruB [Actinomycetota bacterium]
MSAPSAGGPRPAPEGLVLVDKPGGMTSHDVVNRVRRALGTRKVGHAGTLDPMATGLLVMGVGRATRLLRYLSGLDKDYEGVGRLGEETDTLDAEGTITRTAPVTASRADVEAAFASMTGDLEQRPPAYSAVKVGGEALYKSARRGEAVEAAPRPIHVSAFDVGSLDGRDVGFRCSVSSGTYVRVLVADAGAALGCGAHLIALRRTRVGPFDLREARPLDDLGTPLPVEQAVRHLPSLRLDHPDEAAAAANGRPLGPAGIEGPYAVFDPNGSLVAVYRDEHAKAVPEMVLAPPV